MLCRLKTLGITVNRNRSCLSVRSISVFNFISAYDQCTPVQIHTNVIELYTLYTNAMRVSIGKTNFCRRILKSGINIRSKSKKYVLLGVDKNGKSDYNIREPLKIPKDIE